MGKTLTVMMPRELTAENGAKHLFIGEFFEEIELVCSHCNGDAPENDCEVCGGSGTYVQKVGIEWLTIKQIYKKAVDYFGE